MARARHAFSLTVLLLVVGCDDAPPGASVADTKAARDDKSAIVESASDAVMFRDIAAAAGIDFHHFNGMTGERYLCEMMGAGAALFDADGDGDLDLYVVTGRVLGVGKTAGNALIPPRGRPHDRLYRNDTKTVNGIPRVQFTDVTEQSGIGSTGYGMGVAAGDYDNDGRPDLYVTAFGANRLLHNEGNCRFRDVTSEAGVGDTRWSTSAAFLDVDRDGLLDLYVANYVDFQLSNNTQCFSRSSRQDYCSPSSYSPVHDRLFRNRGDGRFEDITVSSQIARAQGSGLGVVAADFNGDGWIDIYVANDGDPNQLWINGKNGTFEDTSLLAGSAVNEDGEEEAGMGVDAGDFDGDGDEDIVLTHLAAQTHTLYANDGRGWFRDVTTRSGLGAATLGRTGFGCAWIDVDNDGDLDFIAANGAVQAIEEQVSRGLVLPLEQCDQLFLNDGSGVFEDVSGMAGDSFATPHVGRGVALGDIDNDGDMDLVVTANGGPLRLLINEVGQRHRWLGVRVLDGRRHAHGARVEVQLQDGRSLWGRVRTDGSYLCARDPRCLFGLGKSGVVRMVRVHWVGEDVEEWSSLDANRWHTLRKGTGRKN